ncbi:hypothetical protein EJ377_14365 [Chryseobacterium arthrosphaerae]|uniref:Uncharacterized protein n=1 Tax=Chryseobacterium arthrosphaerae TaxID=651561 RepID=A0A432DRZ5_9FLAO|nr:hypothetical protein EJ377_14365 [Chryseobacterium arthrosphaerae]
MKEENLKGKQCLYTISMENRQEEVSGANTDIKITYNITPGLLASETGTLTGNNSYTTSTIILQSRRT